MKVGEKQEGSQNFSLACGKGGSTWVTLNLNAKQGQTSLELGWETSRCARLYARFEFKENISEDKTLPHCKTIKQQANQYLFS